MKHTLYRIHKCNMTKIFYAFKIIKTIRYEMKIFYQAVKLIHHNKYYD